MKVIEWDGEKISKPGIYSGVPNKVYHGDLCIGPSVSKSNITDLEDENGQGSPALFFAHWYLNKNRVERKASDAMIHGSATHHLILGEQFFRMSFVESKFDKFLTAEAKQWKAQMEFNNKAVLKSDAIEKIKSLARRLEKEPLIQQGLLNGLIEHTVVWQDPKTGLWLKSRPDAIPEADGVLADLKIVTDASSRAVQKSIVDMGYDIQGALGRLLLKKAAGIDITDFVLVPVERDPPHLVNIRPVAASWLDRGARKLRRGLDTIAACMKADRWPGYESEADIGMPDWLYQRNDRETAWIKEHRPYDPIMDLPEAEF